MPMVFTRLALLLVLNVLLQVAGEGGAQEASETLEVQSDQYAVRLIRQEGGGYKDMQYPTWVFLVQDKLTHSESLIQMQNETDKIDNLALFDAIFIVLGNNRYSAQTTTLFDLTTKKQKDFIWGYKMGISSTKRYLIYDQFYPRFSDAGATSDIILVYDLSKSPSENRVGLKTQSFDAVVVGHPIYPEENLHKHSYREWLEDERDRHSVGPSYLWLKDDKQVSFLDYYHDTEWLVLVDLSEGLEQARIRKTVLDMAKIAAEALVVDPKSKDPAAWLQTAAKNLRIKDLTQKTERKVTIQIEPDYLHRYQYKTLEVEVPLP